MSFSIHKMVSYYLVFDPWILNEIDLYEVQILVIVLMQNIFKRIIHNELFNKSCFDFYINLFDKTFYFRDMCSAEDTELQTSALKLRGDDQQINKKSTCCSKSS